MEGFLIVTFWFFIMFIVLKLVSASKLEDESRLDLLMISSIENETKELTSENIRPEKLPTVNCK